MKSLALRKAKVNAGGRLLKYAWNKRRKDIVKSYSGQTIEILNTDAEADYIGDALTYTEKNSNHSLL